MAKYTTEDLLLYIYGETSKEQGKLISEALKSDWNLREKYDVLKQSMDTLDKMVVSPRAESVAAILKYAATTAGVSQP